MSTHPEATPARDFAVLGLIPARGGSKAVPRKNIKPLCGKPLLQYIVEAARFARSLTKVILSTDDDEIAAVGRDCGLDVPFLRPPELALDETPMLPVVQHAVRWLEQTGEFYDAVCLLQPTNPLRRSEDIDACVELLRRSGADSVVTILPVPAEYNPHWVYFQDGDEMLAISTGEAEPISRRQALPPAFHREGSVYVTRRDVLASRNSLYGTRMAGYLLDHRRCVNIDTPEDWARAESLLRPSGPELKAAGSGPQSRGA
jgi:CMP-N-acetylneuraminic acid synthetase